MGCTIWLLGEDPDGVLQQFNITASSALEWLGFVKSFIYAYVWSNVFLYYISLVAEDG